VDTLGVVTGTVEVTTSVLVIVAVGLGRRVRGLLVGLCLVLVRLNVLVSIDVTRTEVTVVFTLADDVALAQRGATGRSSGLHTS